MSRAVSRPSGGPDGEGELSKSEIFDLLRNQRRRLVLQYLKTHEDEAVRLGDLAEVVAAWEYDTPRADVSSTQRKRVYTTLQQSHLPKMDDADIVDFDADRGVIRATDELSELTIYLEIVPGREFAWHEYYLGLGAVSVALMAALWAGVEPLTRVDPLVWGSLVAGAVALSAAVHVVVQRQMGIGTGWAPQELEIEE